jgi:hypothetical protein
MINLTRKDRCEIYYALETKSLLLRQRKLGRDNESREDNRWIAHLEAIKRKIGPDGANIARGK